MTPRLFFGSFYPSPIAVNGRIMNSPFIEKNM